jgi:hypothetical protein
MSSQRVLKYTAHRPAWELILNYNRPNQAHTLLASAAGKGHFAAWPESFPANHGWVWLTRLELVLI